MPRLCQTDGLNEDQTVKEPTATKPLVSLLSHPLSAPADRIAEALRAGGPRRTICSAWHEV